MSINTSIQNQSLILKFMKNTKTEMQKIVQSRDSETEVLVDVSQWLVSESVNDQYIEHPKSLWLLWNYFRRIGLRKVYIKLKSRFSEKDRNNKVAGIFIGRIVEAPKNFDLDAGQAVMCFAPNQSRHSKMLSLDKNFVMALPKNAGHHSRESYILSSELRDFVPWSRFSGVQLNKSALITAMDSAARSLPIVQNIKQNSMEEYSESIERSRPENDKPTAVLFGLGNYAKTSILPNIKRNINLQRVHEIDPEQLKFLAKQKGVSLDTSATPRDNLRFDVWFIAGFHHTHSALAIAALEQGACAVIEKPLVTTVKQYEEFSRQVNDCENPRFYACFHKRYSELHDLFLRDMKSNIGCPVDMHCIVYEIPLPIHHWYNWPNSGSRLVSNGCHWLDYFMFLNGYSKVVDMRKWIPRGDDMVVQVMLENGAYFSMSLTDTGSQRLGVRDYIELRAAGSTFTMTDGDRYTAENRNRVFTKARVNPLAAYSRMYFKISEDIANKRSGDNKISLRSTKLMLDLESL